MAIQLANLTLVACTEDLCDMGGGGGIIEVEGEEVAGFLGARVQVCGHYASKAQGGGYATNNAHDEESIVFGRGKGLREGCEGRGI